MIRSIAIRLISVLLIANGVIGIAAVWVGWSVTSDLLDRLRQSSSIVAAQQSSLVASVQNVAVAVEDSARATAGLSRSSTRGSAAVTDAMRTADNLAGTFDYLAEGSRTAVFGVRPLEGMAQSFDTNAEDFRQLSASLAEISASLSDNSREMARVGDDLRRIDDQLDVTARNLEALPATRLLDDGLSSLELGSRLLLGVILFEALLSALTGLALLMMTVQPGTVTSGRPVLGQAKRGKAAEA